ncbi:MAG: prepilin-type N-terminal cleavage/methylation domain-containing protein [Deltaproteobacteria bacterium]|nr:prepilin-type N-terminal cleavage/methylation domain-containing protein [Deltaproteobacteria bacterium]
MKNNTKQMGFTLLELMIVVAILAILAAVAIVAYRKYVERAHTAEATSILSDIRIKQEAYRSTFRQYFSDPTYRPVTTAGATGQLWPGANPWAQLGVTPDNDLYYIYIIEAGVPDVAPSVITGTGITGANDFWYAARAKADLNGDGECNGFEVYHGNASIAELPNAPCANY